jgi:two-component system sensor histidine kinase PilS (NtrC family)
MMDPLTGSNAAPPLDSRQKSLNTVKGLMLCRIFFLTLFLTIVILFQLSEKKYFFVPLTNEFYYFIGLFYGVTIIYALLLKKVQDSRSFALVQLVIDHFFIGGLIYFTGGIESSFPIAYIISIIGSSIFFYQRGAFFSASLASFLYGLLLLLQFHRWIHPPGQRAVPYEASQIFYSLILYVATFYIVAFLSGLIAEELRKKKRELIQKQDDYNQLETFNRNIIQSLDSGLLTIDREGNINFLNRTAEKILAVSGERLKDVSVYNLFPRISGVIDEIKKKGAEAFPDYQRYETLFVNPDGRKIYLGFSISPLTATDGSLMGYTLIFQDITRFKEMEEQMKRVDTMAAIGQLAAGMAHEIRNPLTSLSGSIQVLKSELVLDHPGQRLMDIVLRESERLNALIRDFLLFAQPPRTNKRTWKLGSILEETLELFVNSAEYHEGIRIIRPHPHDGVQAMIDPDQMKQVFWNLLINAAQSMPQGGALRLQLQKGGEGLPAAHRPPASSWKTREWVRISISDSGCGIVEPEKGKIFEPFYTTKDGGTGLGLSIVHKIIESHDGLITVESEVGKGSTFTIFLPIHIEEERKPC